MGTRATPEALCSAACWHGYTAPAGHQCEKPLRHAFRAHFEARLTRSAELARCLQHAALMSNWEKPSFEELAMNAEIGGYQPDYDGGERPEPPFVKYSGEARRSGSRIPHLVAAFLGDYTTSGYTPSHG